MINLYPADTAAPPALFTAGELRAHCRVDTADDDAFLLALAQAAQRHVEQITSHALTSRAMVASAEAWDEYRLVVLPVSAVGAITYTDVAGAPTTLPGGDVVVRTRLRLAHVRFAAAATAPELGDDPLINIALTAGYATGECPADLRQACLLLVGHWYRNREAVTIGSTSSEVDLAVGALVSLRRVQVEV